MFAINRWNLPKDAVSAGQETALTLQNVIAAAPRRQRLGDGALSPRQVGARVEYRSVILSACRALIQVTP
jgi:hypothetical protein